MFRVLVATVTLFGALSIACGAPHHAEPRHAAAAHRETASAKRIASAAESLIEGSLLASYVEGKLYPPRAIDVLVLTRDAKKLVESILMYAAQDLEERVLPLVTDDATWGLPDRAKRGSLPLDGENLDAFIVAFRAAANRFPRKPPYRCAVLSPAGSLFAGTGAEPMWCYYYLADGSEQIVFELVTHQGRARVSYVGFFEERPAADLIVADKSVPPDRPPLKRRGLDSTRQSNEVLDPRRPITSPANSPTNSPTAREALRQPPPHQ
ncbi:MAG: hypothetical protein V3V08_25695 [Nannocystaceae bacterium]